jgi:hypothetical protein
LAQTERTRTESCRFFCGIGVAFAPQTPRANRGYKKEEKMRSRIMLTAVLMLILGGIAQAGGPGTFNNDSISGTYVVTLSGHGQPVLQPGDPSGGSVQAVVGIGILTFDGSGSVTAGGVNINANGDFNGGFTIGTNATAGTYSVNSDGTCTITIPVSGFNNVLDEQWACVVESPEKVDFIGIPPGTTLYSLIQGTLTKQQSSYSHHH